MMKTFLLSAALLAAAAFWSGQARAQSNGGVTGGLLKNYQDLSVQRSRMADRKKKREEEAKKKKEEADKKKAEQRKNGKDKNGQKTGFSRVSSNDKRSSGSRTSSHNSKLSSRYSQTGQNTGVTKMMIDAVQTHRVSFDPAKARENPGVILLNPPVYKRGDNADAGTSTLAEPL